MSEMNGPHAHCVRLRRIPLCGTSLRLSCGLRPGVRCPPGEQSAPFGGGRAGAELPRAMILLVRTDRTQAFLLRDLLAQHGIKAHVFNQNMSSIVGDVPPDVALPQVWLDDDADRDRA